MVFSAFSKISFTTGAITGAITTPLDVIKTRLMVQVLEICLVISSLKEVSKEFLSLSEPLQGSANQYKGICDCVRTIVKEEGSHALLKV